MLVGVCVCVCVCVCLCVWHLCLELCDCGAIRVCMKGRLCTSVVQGRALRASVDALQGRPAPRQAYMAVCLMYRGDVVPTGTSSGQCGRRHHQRSKRAFCALQTLSTALQKLSARRRGNYLPNRATLCDMIMSCHESLLCTVLLRTQHDRTRDAMGCGLWGMRIRDNMAISRTRWLRIYSSLTQRTITWYAKLAVCVHTRA